MWKRLCTAALIAGLLVPSTACFGAMQAQGADTEGTWSFPAGAVPDTEYERAFWYGFVAEDDEQDREAGMTEQEMVDLLTAVISASGGDVTGWEEMTAGASDQAIYRDYGAMLLLYAAERMDATEFTNGFAPYLIGGRTDEDWDAFGTDIRGGYPLFEEGPNRWDRTCTSISGQMEDGQEMNYLNASQNYAISRLSLITGEPLLDFSYDSFTMSLTEPLTYEDGAVAAVRLFESRPETAAQFPEAQAVTSRAQDLLQAGRDRRDAILAAETTIAQEDGD